MEVKEEQRHLYVYAYIYGLYNVTVTVSRSLKFATVTEIRKSGRQLRPYEHMILT